MHEGKSMYLLEGNIAAGKSTIGEILRDEFGYGFIEEPVSAWQKDFDENLLDLFYSDMKRWAFTFQLAAFITRAKTRGEVLALDDHDKVILERSIFCDRYVFAKNCYESGLMKKTEWQLYCKMWDWLQSNWCAEPDKIIYLRVPASICADRIELRGRDEENGIPFEYLHDLEILHDEWLLENPKCIIINAVGMPQQLIAREVVQAIKGG